MTKRILLLLIALSATLVLLVVFDEADYDEQVQRSGAIDGLGRALSIPNQEPINDPEVFWPILARVAEQCDVNVFRKTDGWGFDDQPFVAYYVLLTSDETDFYGPFRLRDGRFLNASETQGGSRYLSSAPETVPDQVGVIDDIGRNNRCFIYGLDAVFDTYPVAGSYVVEAKSQEDEDVFISTLEEALAEAGASVDLRASDDAPREPIVYGYGVGFAQTAVWLAILAAVIMIVYRQLYEAKRTAVLLLYGNSSLKTWFLISGRPIISAMAVFTAIGFLAALLIPGSTMELAVAIVVRLAGMAALLVATSLITLLFIRSVNIHEALKNRKDTRALVALNLVVKSVLCIVLVYMGAVSIGMYTTIQDGQDRYGSWEHTSQYGIFYPWTLGLDASEPVHSGRAEMIFDLYPALNDDGALFIETTDYLPIALGYGTSGYRSIRANPNYLEVYPVKDANGDPVVVSEDETDWILLVPESYRSEESQIVEHWRQRRHGGGGVQPAWETDVAMFGRTVKNPQPDQDIRIIWTAVDQQIFSFNPEVYPENANNITDPIIEVMTISNSRGFDRANGINGGLDASFKVKLIEGNTAMTYERYLPLLQELGLDDNIRQLVTLDNAIFSLMQDYHQGLLRYLFQMMMVFALFLILVFQSVPLLFELDARRVAVRKLYGYPFFSRQRRFFIVFTCVWVGIFVAVVACNSVLEWPGGYVSQDLALLLAVAGAFLAIETLVSAVVLSFVESRRVVDVLKGEF